jgi:hypothetical protein
MRADEKIGQGARSSPAAPAVFGMDARMARG